MPSLSRIPTTLGLPFTDTYGREVRGVLRPPPLAGPFFDAGLAPRRSLVVDAASWVTTGLVLKDVDGTRFLTSEWSLDNFMGAAHTRSFVLFMITDDHPWTRAAYTVEPISGQRVTSGDMMKGIVSCAREFVRRKNDSLDIEEEIYRVLCAEPLFVGDMLGDRRVMRSERILGLTYAEVL